MHNNLVTPVHELVTNTPIQQFIRGSAFSDILNTIITLGALSLAFYMFYVFSKYGKHGRDVSAENQEHDRIALEESGIVNPEDRGLYDPSQPGSHKNKIAANRPNVTKKETHKYNTVIKDEFNKHGEF